MESELFLNVEGAAKAIGLTSAAVKKYYSLFEEEGYIFQRSKQGHVLFSPHDIELFKQLIYLKNQPKMTVSNAVKQLVENGSITDIKDISIIKNTSDMKDITVINKQFVEVITEIQELKEIMKHQEKLITNQQDYIDNSLKTRDQLLLESIRGQQELKKIILETQKQLAADLQAKNKKWWKFWKS